MALPKLLTPEFKTKIPSTGEVIKFRPFLVKEEKILYIALEGKDQKDIFNAVMSILSSCILTPGVKVDDFTSYDLEYLFLKLRAKSVGETIEILAKHKDQSECTHATKVKLNIDDIEVYKSEIHENVIQFTDDIGIKCRDPKANVFQTIKESDNEMDRLLKVILECVESVFDKDTIYTEFTKEELVEFIESLNKEQFEKLVTFFNTLPSLEHKVTYVCPECGKEETIEIKGLQSFFTYV
jgi:hypothetical protein